MKHKVKYEDAANYKFEHVMAMSWEDGEYKKLVAVYVGGVIGYEVHSHGKLIIGTFDLKEAVEKYNKI